MLACCTLYTIHKLKMIVSLTAKYRIMTVLKVETYLYTSKAVSPIMFVATFKTNVIVLYRKRHNVFDHTVTDNFIIRVSPLILTLYLSEVKGHTHTHTQITDNTNYCHTIFCAGNL